MTPEGLVETSPDVTWRRSYERASVERFLTYAEGERAQRLHEIERARARTAAAATAAAASREDAPARLAALVVAAQRKVRAARCDTEMAIVWILEDAEAEVTRIGAAALEEAASIRSWAARHGSFRAAHA